jgi:hypothetical protein
MFAVSNKIRTFATKISENHQKINKNMDIKARIEEVINEKGLTKKVVAERMGKFNQAFNSLLTNPKWETIELVATAIGISTQEMLFGIKPEQQPASQPADKMGSAHEVGTEGKQSPDDLPFDNSHPSAIVHQPSLQQAIICPHCGHALVMNVVSYEQK